MISSNSFPFYATLAIALVSGCSERRNPQPVADEGGWLKVTTNQVVIAAAMERGEEAKRVEYEQIFDQLGISGAYIAYGTLSKLRRSEQSVDRLRQIFRDDENRDRKTGAAILLCQLHDKTAATYLTQLLSSGSIEERSRVLNTICYAGHDEKKEQKHRDFLLANDKLVAQLRRHLNDANDRIVAAAVNACGWLQLPDIQRPFLELMRRGHAATPIALLRLAEGPLNAELLEAALQGMSKQPGTTRRMGLPLLEAFAKSEDLQLSVTARSELKLRLAAWPEAGGFGYDSRRLSLLETLATTSKETDLEWLQQTFVAEKGLYAGTVLKALTRMDPDRGRGRLLALLKEEPRHEIAVEALQETFKGSADPEIVAALADSLDANDDRNVANVCSALLDIGGAAAKEHVRSLADRLNPHLRQSLAPRFEENPPPLKELADSLVAAGLIDEAAAKAALKSLSESDEPFYQPAILHLLGEAELLVEFDAETGEIPCRHDKLVTQFSKLSRGRFQPLGISEVFNQKSEDDFDADYTLRFVLAGRLYAGRLRNFGDWYDVERTVKMINRALSDTGIQERFISTGSGGQIASFILADPAKLKPVAQKYHLQLGDDLNEAMNTGKEFEREVLKKLKEANR